MPPRRLEQRLLDPRWPDAFEAVYTLGFAEDETGVPDPIKQAVCNKVLESYSRDLDANDAVTRTTRLTRGGMALTSIYLNANNGLRV